jgi:rhodanese-related sulfurtransferase
MDKNGQTSTVATFLDSARDVVPELTPAELSSALADGGVELIVDVREPGEWAKGHLPGAVHAPRGLLEWFADPASPAAMPVLAAAKSGRVVVTCASGGRSLLAAETLMRMGYPDVASLAGGFNAWQAEQLPVSTD